MESTKSSSLTKRVDRRFRGRKSEAIVALGLSPEDLESAPEIASLLRQSKGGIKAAIQALRFSPDPTAVQFLSKYDSLGPSIRDNAPIEAVALAAKVDIPALLGVAILALQNYSANQVKILAVSNHPGVLRDTLRYAKLPRGTKDREHIHQALGFLPTSKPPSFIGKVFINAGEQPNEPEPEEIAENDLENIFPDLSQVQTKLQPIRQKLLEE